LSNLIRLSFFGSTMYYMYPEHKEESNEEPKEAVEEEYKEELQGKREMDVGMCEGVSNFSPTQEPKGQVEEKAETEKEIMSLVVDVLNYVTRVRCPPPVPCLIRIQYGYALDMPGYVPGWITKRLSEIAMLEQTFIKDDSILVKDFVTQAVAPLGENIRVRSDEGVHWGIQNGLFLSRSTVKIFKHNDMGALEKMLEEVFLQDKRVKKVLNRRFIVVESIYQNSGQMAPLDKIIRLKEKYKFRVLVEESNSFGILGKTGRGITEHYGIPVEKVDIITAGMGYALATTGGFCTGSAKVVDHQVCHKYRVLKFQVTPCHPWSLFNWSTHLVHLRMTCFRFRKSLI
ncbi:hypothetical protein KI387_001287, partial [Taxus chinensis]